MANHLVTTVVILVLSVAFGTVDHDLLLQVLEKQFGVTGDVRKWYYNYLKPRKFRVNISEETSTIRQLDFSVPQGSIQGAFLFISYATTLDKIVTNLTLNGCADDHSIRKEFKPSRLGKDETEIIKTMESSMLGVKDWIDSVCLKMNESRAEFIYFGSTNQLRKCNIT